MKTFEVVIEEVLKYKITVEAENESQAEDKAFASQEFAENNFQDNDAKAISVTVLEENENE